MSTRSRPRSRAPSQARSQARSRARSQVPARAELPLQLGLDPAAPQPLHAQLREALRGAILAGRLAPGARLPASRVLAADLGCARGTVLLALEQLAAEGYLAARPGSGTRVAASLPDDLTAGPPAPDPARTPADAAPVLSRRGARLAAGEAEGHAGDPGLPDGATPDAFALGRPALDVFPFETWAKLLAAEWRDGASAQAHALGDPRLRAAVAAYLAAGRGVPCSAQAVILTASIRQSLRLLAELLLDPGEAALVEEPGFPGIARALRGAGLRIVPVPIGPQGFSAARARALAPGARLAVVTPAQHYPLGTVMSLENRLALLAWAEAAGGWIVEDDYDGAYRYTGRPVAPLSALDRNGRVIYVGSVSKVLLPALQLSYLVLPPSLIEPVQRALRRAGVAASALGQGALARFIAEGHFASHLRRTRKLYAARQAALVEAAGRHLAGTLAIPPLDGGLHLVARPDPGFGAPFDDVGAAAACARAGLTVAALSPYFADASAAEPGLLLGYAALPERAIAPAVRRLAEVLRARP
ncbi:MocR-like pyridoxine biosynthesis transcription factor PdxR [Methylobacterium planeticum]|uniref:8-amino-7-oxononanoate synthase n=1 Tax=Methylobacterium planeticum TaxID=2615211 RepID=A0A6N6MYE7_9HYPH|nr:PLP-dependent aminotransferase family protein [Methylobacterium planeticum]KAB1074362.1 PLP-dependent aminotransferase family protein [Methylobacterium planeticum]